VGVIVFKHVSVIAAFENAIEKAQ